jgi:hypothetical protein
MLSIIGYGPGTVVLDIVFFSTVSLRLVMNIFPFLVSTAKLIGDF